MPIFRNKTQKDFTMISNNVLKDKELKMVDRGVYCTLCSFPDVWNFSIEGLTKLVPDGETIIRNSIKRLEDNGYMKRSKERDAQGKFISVIEILAKKQEEDNSPSAIIRDGKPTTDNPRRITRDGLSTTENQGQYNTNNIKLNINSKNNKINPSDERMIERLF